MEKYQVVYYIFLKKLTIYTKLEYAVCWDLMQGGGD